jgi:hypothetical protein
MYIQSATPSCHRALSQRTVQVPGHATTMGEPSILLLLLWLMLARWW